MFAACNPNPNPPDIPELPAAIPELPELSELPELPEIPEFLETLEIPEAVRIPGDSGDSGGRSNPSPFEFVPGFFSVKHGSVLSGNKRGPAGLRSAQTDLL